MKLTLGSDPEIFVVQNRNSSTVVPAIGLVPGTKAKPSPLLLRGNDVGTIQVDGFALEFNTPPIEIDLTDPRDTARRFQDAVNFCMTAINEDLATKDLKVSKRDYVVFKEDVIASAPPENRDLGCEPDYNAYTGKTNPRPDPAKAGHVGLRTAGGHIHLGWGEGLNPHDPDHFKTCCTFTKMLDRVFYYTSFMGSDTRRNLYGNFGSFRPKPYGMEYRPLSNTWLFDGNPTAVATTVVSAINTFFPKAELFEKATNINQVRDMIL